jgi:uncharacterized protein YecT (DUF1311 family)
MERRHLSESDASTTTLGSFTLRELTPVIMRALLLLSSLLSLPALAADPDPLDAALDACLAKPEGASTPGMIDCTGEAIRAWDKRLNKVYREVMAGLDTKSRELVRTSQRRWVAFRAAEHEAMEGPWRQDKGTIIRVLTADAELSAIKERVQALQLYGPDGG